MGEPLEYFKGVERSPGSKRRVVGSVSLIIGAMLTGVGLLGLLAAIVDATDEGRGLGMLCFFFIGTHGIFYMGLGIVLRKRSR